MAVQLGPNHKDYGKDESHRRAIDRIVLLSLIPFDRWASVYEISVQMGAGNAQIHGAIADAIAAGECIDTRPGGTGYRRYGSRASAPVPTVATVPVPETTTVMAEPTYVGDREPAIFFGPPPPPRVAKHRRSPVVNGAKHCRRCSEPVEPRGQCGACRERRRLRTTGKVAS